MVSVNRAVPIFLLIITVGCAQKSSNKIEPVIEDTISQEASEVTDPVQEFTLNENLSAGQEETYENITEESITQRQAPIPHEKLRAIRDLPKISRENIAQTSTENKSVWQVIEDNFALEAYQSNSIDKYYKAMRQHPKSVARIEQRAKYYMPTITKAVVDAGLPGEIALLPIVESNLKPMARSRAGAGGLWQFMPATGQKFGLVRNTWWDSRFDVNQSTKSAIKYLSYLNQRFKGDWLLTLAAYNCGEGCVSRAIKKNKAEGKSTHYFELSKLPRETRNYVPKLLAIKKLMQNNFAQVNSDDTARFIPFQPAYQNVQIDKPTELSVVATATKVSLEDLQILNSAILKGVTPPGMSVELHIPINVDPELIASIENIPASSRVSWHNYTVRKGDTLGRIAGKYSIPTSTLKDTNNIKGSLIRIGQQLIIPTPSTRTTANSTSIPSDVQKNAASHRVRRGDTLWEIARHYKISVHQLTKANSLNRRMPIKPGQVLSIPK